MNPVGIHFGYWTQYWDVDQLPFVARARKTGFDILEVRAQKIARMSKAELDTLKAAAAEAGLGLTYSIGMTAEYGAGALRMPPSARTALPYFKDL